MRRARAVAYARFDSPQTHDARVRECDGSFAPDEPMIPFLEDDRKVGMSAPQGQIRDDDLIVRVGSAKNYPKVGTVVRRATEEECVARPHSS